MKYLSLTAALDDVSTLRRNVEARNTLRPHFTDTFSTVLEAAGAAWAEFVGTSPRHDLAAAVAALNELSHATTGVLAMQFAAAELVAIQGRIEQGMDIGAQAMEHLIDVARAEVPDALVAEEHRELFHSLRNSDLDATRHVRGMAALHRSIDVEVAKNGLDRINQLRMRACLGQVLVRLAGTTAPPPGDMATLATDALSAASAATRQLRDSAIDAARKIRTSVVPPVVSQLLWAALYTFETTFESTLAEQLAVAMSAAFEGAGDIDANFSAMRKAGQAFDAFSCGLAFDAGIRAMLTASALGDEGVMRSFAQVASLPVGSATLDLPRSSLASVARAGTGDVVEFDGVISQADFVEGGPAPRSVLTISQGAGATVTVLVPFSSVDSFGLIPGVWAQFRGTVFAEGKDGIDGVVVQVRRIRLQDAQQESASDRLVWLGRHLFGYRPGGYDIVAGRPSGRPESMTQLDLRQGVN